MNVYTVTYIHKNYGSALQAFALQTVLKSLGVNPIVLLKKSQRKHFLLYRLYSFLAQIWYILIPQKDYGFFKRLRLTVEERKSYKKYHKIDTFVWERIRTYEIANEIEFLSKVSDSDFFLAGSDQIWGTANQSLSSWYSLQWVDERHLKYSYAASIGQSSLTTTQLEEYHKGLDSFRIISLREKQAVELLYPFFKEKIRQDLDPTLLCDGTFWKSISSPRFIKGPYIFVYRLRPNEDVIEIARNVSHKMGCRIVYAGLYSYSKQDICCVNDAGVEDFLSLIEHAEAVVTNSFHGTVFSILMEKPFLSVRISTTGSRAESLLDTLGLKSQLVDNSSSSYGFDIDYSKVKSKLIEEREKSLSYLRNICFEREQI